MGYGRVQREREVFQVVESHVLIDMLPARGRKRRQKLSTDILGIHHVTAIADDPQRNIDFYTGVLGLRLVKLTVNLTIHGPTTCIMGMSWVILAPCSRSLLGQESHGDGR